MPNDRFIIAGGPIDRVSAAAEDNRQLANLTPQAQESLHLEMTDNHPASNT